MKSALPRRLPERYVSDLLQEVDGRSVEARRWRDRLEALVEECGGAEGLERTEVEVLSRFVFHSFRMGKLERRELLGEGVDLPSLHDGLRGWIGLLRQVELIKAKHTSGGDLFLSFMTMSQKFWITSGPKTV